MESFPLLFSSAQREALKDHFFSSEDLWRHLLNESLQRYLIKLIYNLCCLITVLLLLPSSGPVEGSDDEEGGAMEGRISLFHPYMVKIWILSTTVALMALFYFFYYYGDGNSQHTVWSVVRLNSVRQAWGGAGLALLLFRGSILVDIILHVRSRRQSLLIILLDVSP